MLHKEREGAEGNREAIIKYCEGVIKPGVQHDSLAEREEGGEVD